MRIYVAGTSQEAAAVANYIASLRIAGPILLHAGKRCTLDDWHEALGWIQESIDYETGYPMPLQRDLPRGGIVGRARIVDMLPASPHEQTYPEGVDGRWHARDQYGFVLADVEPLPFRPWPGALGLFDVPDEVSP